MQQCQQALKQATMFHESISRHFLFLGSDVPLVFKKYIRHRVSCMFNLSAVFLIVEHQSTAKQFGFRGSKKKNTKTTLCMQKLNNLNNLKNPTTQHSDNMRRRPAAESLPSSSLTPKRCQGLFYVFFDKSNSVPRHWSYFVFIFQITNRPYLRGLLALG